VTFVAEGDDRNGIWFRIRCLSSVLVLKDVLGGELNVNITHLDPQSICKVLRLVQLNFIYSVEFGTKLTVQEVFPPIVLSLYGDGRHPSMMKMAMARN
jgi:hypothetical protein